MNLQKLRFIQEVVRHNLNLTETAKALKTSQPSISKAVIELESELGVEIFVRNGKRLSGLTKPGLQMLNSVDVIMREANNLRRIAQDFSSVEAGELSIAATHTQARYVLPDPVMTMRKTYPEVNISLHEGTPVLVAQILRDEVAEVGVSTESFDEYEDLVALPYYEWQYMLAVRPEHPLAKKEKITLQDLVSYPLITYNTCYSGRFEMNQVFNDNALKPNIVFDAIDSDVILIYVEKGFGMGIVAEMALETAEKKNLVMRPLNQLFGLNMTKIVFKRGTYLRKPTFIFVELLAPNLTRDVILKAIRSRK